MSVLLSIVAGWTDVIGPFTLRVDGTPLNLTGFTVTLSLRGPSGAVTPGGTVTVLNQGTNPGQVTYTPVADDFVFVSSGNQVRQSYLMHWKVVDGAGRIVYFPNGEADEISVYQP